MTEKTRYFVLKQKAVPEVLLKVVEAKRILDGDPSLSVQTVTERLGLSRSSFYKYKNDIFPFHDEAQGKTVTFLIQIEDEPGLLSTVLNTIAQFGANILTIHQTIPISGVATLTLSVQVLSTTGDMSAMIGEIEKKQGVRYLKILGRE
ncbi:MAG: ACT domain-containing protein [Eubacteriales bacterium]|nr:ACT domain-containing protein [Eubacteriales bacterium]